MYVWSLHVTSYSNTSNSNMNHKQSVSFLLVGSQILRMFSSHLNWSTGLCPWTVPYWAYRFSRTPSPTRSFPMCCYASNFSPNLQMTLFMILHFGHFERSIFHIRKKKKASAAGWTLNPQVQVAGNAIQQSLEQILDGSHWRFTGRRILVTRWLGGKVIERKVVHRDPYKGLS